MEMQQIRYFVAVAETLNFTHAAERCNVSQPSLTRAIQQLEFELGGELIRRERSLTHLTELGSRMLPLMQQCYETALAAKGLAQSVKKGESSPLSLAVSWSVDLNLVAPFLSELSRALRGLQLNLRRGTAPEITTLLKQGQVELAVAGPLGEVWERIEAFPLFTEPFRLVLNQDHALAARDAVELADLSGERLLVQVEAEMAGELDKCLCDAGIDTSAAVHRVASCYDLLSLLEANLGVSVMPAGLMPSERLRRVAIDGLELTRPLTLYAVAGRRRSVAGNTLMTLLRSADWSEFAQPHPIQGTRRA